MALALGFILVGALLVYAGWWNKDLRGLLTGDNQRPKTVRTPPAFGK